LKTAGFCQRFFAVAGIISPLIYKGLVMGRFGDEDAWIGRNNERIPKTIEEKAEMTARVINGIVSLARDVTQSGLRTQAMREMQRSEVMLDIHPTDVQRIMGDIPTEKLRSDTVINAGKAEAIRFLSKLKTHLDLNKEDKKNLYLRVLSAMVVAIQAESSGSVEMKN
jgi:hypothetical protein